MDFSEVFKNYKELVSNRLSDILDKKEEEFRESNIFETDVFEVLKHFSTRGKMLRGSLLLFSANSHGLKTGDDILGLACSLELMHSALLIHDDIMDNDELRRGEKTVFARYKEKGKRDNLKDPEHYGISMGIVVGDIALFIAEELSVSLSNNLKKILDFYSKELRTVGLGQLLDFSYGVRNEEFSIEQIEKMYISKSARYTFTLPLYMGGLAAGGNDRELLLLEDLGEKIGLIFQLIDDDIGIFGTEEEIGKPVGSDIRENKKTFMRSLLMERANGETREYLQKTFGDNNLTNDDVVKVREIIGSLKVREEIAKKIDSLSIDVKKIIESMEIEDTYKKLYADLLEYNTKRSF